MTRWRARVGDAGAEEMLKETIAAGLRLKLSKPTQLARVNVDTTVQEKNIRYPTDARLLSRARERVVDLAKAEGIELGQSYGRVGKQLLHQQARYAQARQFKRARKAVKKVRTYLWCVIRDSERKTEGLIASKELQELLATGRKLLLQERNSKNKVYSVHAPEVECISKGKAHKRYEFGCKVSIGATSKGGWVVAAQAQHGNPYDGHTLASTIEQLERLTETTPNEVFVDMGYRKHDYTGTSLIHVDRRRRGNIPRNTWRWMKRRAAIEPTLGHLKDNKRLDRKRLKGVLGDKINVILSAAGMNFHSIMKTLARSRALLIQILDCLLGIRIGRPAAMLFQLG